MRPTLSDMDGELWMYVRDYKRLASIVIVQGHTHRDLARAAGYKSHTYIGRLLRGEAKTLEPEAAIRIAHFLGLPSDDLFVPRVSSVTGQNGQAAA